MGRREDYSGEGDEEGHSCSSVRTLLNWAESELLPAAVTKISQPVFQQKPILWECCALKIGACSLPSCLKASLSQ